MVCSLEQEQLGTGGEPMVRSSLLLLTLSLSATAADGPTLSFKGIELGKSTAADVQQRFPGARTYASTTMADPRSYADAKCGSLANSIRDSSVSKCRTDAIVDQLFRIGQTSSGDFLFVEQDGTIAEVRATFTTSSFPAVVAALEEKYGKASSREASEVKSKAGASFDSTIVVWKHPDGEIVVRERSGRIDHMSLIISTGKAIERRKDEFQKSVKDAAKAL
jgi:hypothetical protein